MQKFHPSLQLLIVLISTLSILTHAEEQGFLADKSIYIGLSAGSAGGLSLKDSTGEFELANGGGGTAATIGLEFNEAARIEFGHLSVHDTNLIFVSGNDIDIDAQFLVAGYTFKKRFRKSYLRPKGGIFRWKGSALESGSILFIDVSPDDPISFKNDGTGAFIGLEYGLRFSDMFEWNVIGFEKLLGSDLDYHRTYTGISFYY